MLTTNWRMKNYGEVRMMKLNDKKKVKLRAQASLRASSQLRTHTPRTDYTLAHEHRRRTIFSPIRNQLDLRERVLCSRVCCCHCEQFLNRSGSRARESEIRRDRRSQEVNNKYGVIWYVALMRAVPTSPLLCEMLANGFPFVEKNFLTF